MSNIIALNTILEKYAEEIAALTEADSSSPDYLFLGGKVAALKELLETLMKGKDE